MFTRLKLNQRWSKTLFPIMIDLWATSTVAQCLETERSKSYAKFLDDYDVGLRYIEVTVYVVPPLAQGADI